MNPPPPTLRPPTITATADILGVRVDTASAATVRQRAVELMMGPRAACLLTANALIVLEARKNPVLADACRAADIVTADSVGVVWAAARLRQPSVPRLPGIDLAKDLCRNAAALGQSIFLLGAAPGVAAAAAERLREAIPGLTISRIRDGFFSSDDHAAIVSEMAASGARLFLLALGVPKQELFFHRHRNALPPGLYIGVGGSFDVWSGRLRRAPQWMQKMGLEWLFRLAQEPSRVGRMIHLPRFVLQVLRESL